MLNSTAVGCACSVAYTCRLDTLPSPSSRTTKCVTGHAGGSAPLLGRIVACRPLGIAAGHADTQTKATFRVESGAKVLNADRTSVECCICNCPQLVLESGLAMIPAGDSHFSGGCAVQVPPSLRGTLHHPLEPRLLWSSIFDTA